MSISRKDFFTMGSAAMAATVLPNVSGTGNKIPSLIKPKALQEGATLGLVAPASPIHDEADFEQMLLDLERLGYKYKLGHHVKDKYGYLAGKDEDRASDLMSMFEDEEVDGIITVRGGWGCNRILPYLDFEKIKNNPKLFAGFSDITSLHQAILSKTGLVTFHGPVGKSDWNEFTELSWRSVVQNKQMPVFQIPEDDLNSFHIHSGSAKGHLLGGNLTVLTSMIGSDYLPAFNGAILFLEDVGEDAYRIDRMLTQLSLAGILQQINGLVFGKCTDCDAGARSLTLAQVFEDHISPLNIPAFYGAMISHEKRNITIPMGVQAEMNADTMSFKLLESGVI